jgi:hypothetical protein
MMGEPFCDLGIGAYEHRNSLVGRRAPMDADLVAKINRAVDDCLGRCSQSSTPPEITVRGFCAELSADPTWSSSEVDLVRTTVQRTLGSEGSQ